MKALTNRQLTQVSKRLDQFFNLATKQEINNGINWYKKANNICKEIAEEYDTCEIKVAGVISALSPRNKWERNIKDARTVFQAIKDGKGPNDVKVSTFHQFKFKAFEIAKGNQKIEEKSKKTFAFINNIAHLDDKFVTIDIWHLRACFKGHVKSSTAGKIAYQQIQDLTIKKAEEVGLKGYEYQAVIWESIRNKYVY
jgi:hypothetical protein